MSDVVLDEARYCPRMPRRLHCHAVPPRPPNRECNATLCPPPCAGVTMTHGLGQPTQQRCTATLRTCERGGGGGGAEVARAHRTHAASASEPPLCLPLPHARSLMDVQLYILPIPKPLECLWSGERDSQWWPRRGCVEARPAQRGVGEGGGCTQLTRGGAPLTCARTPSRHALRPKFHPRHKLSLQ